MDIDSYIAGGIAVVLFASLFVNVIRLGRFRREQFGDRYSPRLFGLLLVPFWQGWRRQVDPAHLNAVETYRLRLFWIYYGLFLLPFLTAITYMRWDTATKLQAASTVFKEAADLVDRSKQQAGHETAPAK